MKDIFLRILGLVAAALQAPPDDDDARIQKVEEDLAKLREDIQACRADSPIADPEVQAELDRVVGLATRATVAEEDEPSEEEQAAADEARTRQNQGEPPASDQS